jgi:uncharacterized protein
MSENYELSDQEIQARVSNGKGYILFFYKAGPRRDQPPAEQERLQREHLRYLFKLRGMGRLALNGPVTDDETLLGIGIFDFTDLAEAARLLDGDPAVQAGRLVYEIHAWFGLPGDQLP